MFSKLSYELTLHLGALTKYKADLGFALQGLPQQNGESNFDAGDRLAEAVDGSDKFPTWLYFLVQEASFALKTNDPAGFNIVDVFAW